MVGGEGCASPDNAEGTETPKRRIQPRSWLDTASPPPQEHARGPAAPSGSKPSNPSTTGRVRARRQSHGWTTVKRRRQRTPSPELEADPVEEEVESYLRLKWTPGEDRVDWTAGDWWRAHKNQFPHIEKLARQLLAMQVKCSTQFRGDECACGDCALFCVYRCLVAWLLWWAQCTLACLRCTGGICHGLACPLLPLLSALEHNSFLSPVAQGMVTKGQGGGVCQRWQVARGHARRVARPSQREHGQCAILWL